MKKRERKSWHHSEKISIKISQETFLQKFPMKNSHETIPRKIPVKNSHEEFPWNYPVKNSRENSLPATDIFHLCYISVTSFFAFLLTFFPSLFLFLPLFVFHFYFYFYSFFIFFSFYNTFFPCFLFTFFPPFFLSFSLLFFDFRILYLQQIWMIAASTTTFDLVRGLHDGSGKKQNVLFSPFLNLHHSPDLVFYLFLHNNHNYFDIILIFW